MIYFLILFNFFLTCGLFGYLWYLIDTIDSKGLDYLWYHSDNLEAKEDEENL